MITFDIYVPWIIIHNITLLSLCMLMGKSVKPSSCQEKWHMTWSDIISYLLLIGCLCLFVCIRIEEKDVDTEKEAAMEAELKAARERAVVPQEARMSQFKDMLLERGVNRDILYKQKQMTQMGTFLLTYTVKNLRSKCLNYLSYKYKFHRQLSVASTDVFFTNPYFLFNKLDRIVKCPA